MVQVKCKKCGRSADADSFVLDYIEKKMVCALCAKSKKVTPKTTYGMSADISRPRRIEKQADDDFIEEPAFERPNVIRKADRLGDLDLDMTARKEIKIEPKVSRIDNERVKYTCPKCGYIFVYNTVTERPKKCNYCEQEVGEVNLKDTSGTYDLDF